MEKVIKIATVLIFVTLTFLFLFNLRRWLRKKGYFNNNKVVDQQTNNKVNKNIPSKIDDDNENPGLNILGYFLAFSTAFIYSISQGYFRSLDRLHIAGSIGTALGVILGPGIVAAIISGFTKKNYFGALLGGFTIIIVLMNYSLR